MRDPKGFLLYNVPSFLFLLFLVLLPVLGTIYTSLFREVTFLDREFTFPRNYLFLIEDPLILESLCFTLKFTLVSVLVELVLGVFLALAINQKVPMRGLIRGVALIPWAIPTVVSARVWETMFNYSYGLLNFVTELLFGTRINWLGTDLGAFLVLVVADAWRTTPFVALIVLAGLQSIPKEIYDQAKVDGAGTFRTFLFITLPLLKPFILVALVFRTVDALRVFDIVFVLTEGGPGGSTTPLSMYAYRLYVMGDFGYGSAVSTVLFLISLTAALLIGRHVRSRL